MWTFFLIPFLIALCAGQTTDPPVETTEPAVATETTDAAVASSDTAVPPTEASSDTALPPTEATGATAVVDRAAKENEQAVTVLSGDTPLFRGWNYRKKTHIYSINPDRFKPAYVNKEGAVGFVVNEANYNEVKKTCPDLEKMYIFTLPSGASYINKEGSPKDKAEVFYCSSKQGYCGANFPLQRFMGKPWQNIFYPSSNRAANQMRRKKGSIYKAPKTICYIWKPIQSNSDDKFKQVRKNVLADKMTIHGCLVRSKPILHKYGLDKEDTHKMKKATCKTRIGAIAHVMTVDQQKKSTAACPDLVKMRMFQKKGTYASTLIAKEEPKDVANYEKGPEFYCAPKRGYCGADREIALFKSNVDFFYPLNEFEDLNARTGMYPEFSNKKESLCWAWTDVEYADTSL